MTISGLLLVPPSALPPGQNDVYPYPSRAFQARFKLAERTPPGKHDAKTVLKPHLFEPEERRWFFRSIDVQSEKRPDPVYSPLFPDERSSAPMDRKVRHQVGCGGALMLMGMITIGPKLSFDFSPDGQGPPWTVCDTRSFPPTVIRAAFPGKILFNLICESPRVATTYASTFLQGTGT